jgi:hypothetical protein
VKVHILSRLCQRGSSSTIDACITASVRINGSRTIYCNNERIKTHVFNAKDNREILN